MLLAAFVAASLALFVWPSQATPRRADAVVVLSGSRVERLPKALQVKAETGTKFLVISGGLDPRWKQAYELCRAGLVSVDCFTPRPDSTRGEAEDVARLARERHWHSLIVVTSTYHVFRARMLFRRCFHGRLDVVGARPPFWRWVTGVPDEWGKLLYQLTFQRGC